MIPGSVNTMLMSRGGINESDIDLSTFTGVEPASDLSIVTTKVTATTMLRDTSTYLYNDYGAGAFDSDFEVLFECSMTAISGNGLAYPCALTNVIGSGDSWGDRIACSFYVSDLRLQESHLGTTYTDTYAISVGTSYWCKLVRDESVGTYGRAYLYIASSEVNRDSETWLSTLTLDLHSKQDFQYFYAISSLNTASPAESISAYVDHISILET